MNKVLLGLLVGAVLGAVDGATAWFTPQVRPEILTIIFFSTIKGVIGGIAAGWFARKVQSVPAGIAFGFAVGLLLAFLVAMQPDPKTGEHYWWQIMLPGSVLGGVVGWATQRYGRAGSRRQPASAAVAMLVLSLVSFNAYAGQNVTSAAAFERLKGLTGTWSATKLEPNGEPTTVEYRVVSNGAAIMETMFVGEPHEMINMYTVDGDTVLATHYCSGGTQPHLKLNTAKSTADELVFDFVSVTGGKDSFVNGVRIRFDGAKVEEHWSATSKDGALRLYLNARK